MKRIVLDTNCLLMCIPKNSPYRIVWDAFDSHFRILEQIPFPKVNLLHLKSFSRMLKGYSWDEDIMLLNEPAVAYGNRSEADDCCNNASRNDMKAAIDGDELLNRLRPRIKSLFK